ncbi:MAG: hypothetical protein Q8O63_04930 [Hoeflea sp.]|nr:hypothetical protein [Hoeflea sp.]
MSTVPFTLRLDKDLKTSLEAEAKLEDRSASYLAARAIKMMLEAKAAKRRLIEEAVAEADKGVFISEEKMNAWVESWDTENELPEPEPDVFLKTPA